MLTLVFCRSVCFLLPSATEAPNLAAHTTAEHVCRYRVTQYVSQKLKLVAEPNFVLALTGVVLATNRYPATIHEAS